MTGERCGKPAVASFVGSDGTTYYECAAHRFGIETRPDTVEVHRYGKTFVGRVIRVKRTGTIVAEITYGNGVKRTVEV